MPAFAPNVDPMTGAPVAPGQVTPIAPAAPQVPPIPVPPVPEAVQGLSEPLEGPPALPPAPQIAAGNEPVPFPPRHWYGEEEGPPPEQAAAAEIPEVPTQAPPGQAPAGLTQPTPEELAVQAAKDKEEADAIAAEEKRIAAMDPYQRYLEKSQHAQEEALKTIADAEIQKNEYLRVEGIKAAEDAKRRQAAADDAYMEATKEAKTKRAQLDKEAQDLANGKIDPGRAWHNLSFGQQLAVAVLAALQGATKQSVRTGKNSVIDAVNGMVARDMQAQQMEYERKMAGLGMRRGMLADEMAANRDLLDFQYKSTMTAYNMTEQALKSAALKYDNIAITGKTNLELAKVADARVNLGMQYENMKAQRALEEKHWQASYALQSRGVALQEKALAEQTAARKAQEEANKNKPDYQQQKIDEDRKRYEAANTVRGVKYKDSSGKTGPVLGPQDTVTKDVNKKLGAYTNFVQGLRRLEEIQQKHGYELMKDWGEDDLKEADTIYEALLTDFSLATEQGVIRKEDYERYEKMFGKIGGIKNAMRNLQTLEREFTQRANNMLQFEIGEDVAYWEPPSTPGASPYFHRGEMPKAQPAPAGLPGQWGSHEPPMSPEAQKLIGEGKFTPTSPPTGGMAIDPALQNFVNQ